MLSFEFHILPNNNIILKCTIDNVYTHHTIDGTKLLAVTARFFPSFFCPSFKNTNLTGR